MRHDLINNISACVTSFQILGHSLMWERGCVMISAKSQFPLMHGGRTSGQSLTGTTSPSVTTRQLMTQSSASALYRPQLCCCISAPLAMITSPSCSRKMVNTHTQSHQIMQNISFRTDVTTSAGTLSLRYRLGIISYKFKLTDRNMADGFPHFVNITRHNYTIWTQVGS